ncbi:unannotated protein [freshwater metagenome]|uniref:Unannotated protein n=1 Tax=freshwater metagenome TaxID=449393 RepID=A0A6J7BMI1_9ZZZZ
MRRSILLAAPLAAAALLVAGCSSSSTPAETSAPAESFAPAESSAPAESTAALKDPGKLTIGLIPSTATSENLGVWTAQFKAAAEVFGYTIDLCDGAGDPTKMEACMSGFVTKKVDAIVTMALGGEEIPNGMKQAAAANIPVMAEGTSVTPGNEALYTGGIYADNIVKSGAATADFILGNADLKDRPIVGVEITQNYGGQGYVNGLRDELIAKGTKYTDLRDTNLADLINSMTKVSEAIFTAHPGKIVMIDFSDFGYALWGPTVKRLNRESEITTITRFDNPSSVKAMKEGAPLITAVTKQWQHWFDLLTALAAYHVDGTPFPPNSETVNEPGATVAAIADFPAGSDRFYPFDPALKEQIKIWEKTYKLQPSTLSAP